MVFLTILIAAGLYCFTAHLNVALFIAGCAAAMILHNLSDALEAIELLSRKAADRIPATIKSDPPEPDVATPPRQKYHINET